MQKKWWISGVVALLAAIFALAGCGGASEADLIGTWKVDTSTLPNATPVPGQEMIAAMAQGMAQNTTIEFKTDKTFSMSLLAIGGTWTFNPADSTVTILSTKMGFANLNAMPGASAKPAVWVLSSDGQRLTSQDSGDGGTLAFVKS